MRFLVARLWRSPSDERVLVALRAPSYVLLVQRGRPSAHIDAFGGLVHAVLLVRFGERAFSTLSVPVLLGVLRV